MNSDELMSDPFGLQGGAAADLLYPPEAGASQAQQANAGNNNPAAWNTKKFKEEYDTMKGRLADQKFSSASYRDPLMPSPPHPKQYPGNINPAIEQRLKEHIAAVRAQST